VTDLGDLGGGLAVATGINSSEQVCGYSFTDTFEMHSFVWDAVNGMQDLETLGGMESGAFAIDGSGRVVGYSSLDGEVGRHACVWTGGEVEDLGVLGGSGSSFATGLNSAGQICGYAELSSGALRAVLFSASAPPPPPPPADTTAPTTALALAGTLGSNGWYTGAVKATLSAEDNAGGSGLATTFFRVNGGDTHTYSAPFSLSAEGTHVLEFWSTDKAGNVETTTAQAVQIDGGAPVLTIQCGCEGLNPPNGKMVAVVFSGKITDTGAGVDTGSARFFVKDEYGQVQPCGKVNVAPDGSYWFTIQLQSRRNGGDSDGRQYKIVVKAADRAGNVSSLEHCVVVGHDQSS
jgi:probable HAF family extracellular repeat protein